VDGEGDDGGEVQEDAAGGCYPREVHLDRRWRWKNDGYLLKQLATCGTTTLDRSTP